jgi:hypothetical protein
VPATALASRVGRLGAEAVVMKPTGELTHDILV